MSQEDFYGQILEKIRKYESSFLTQQNDINGYQDKYTKIIDDYFNFIIPHEGFSPFMYLDTPGGYPTIGYGHLLYFKRNGKESDNLVSVLVTEFSKSKDSVLNRYQPPFSKRNLSPFQNSNMCLAPLNTMTFEFNTNLTSENRLCSTASTNYFQYTPDFSQSSLVPLKPRLSATTNPNLSTPQQIKNYVEITEEQILSIYDEKDACFGLLDALSFPFEVSAAIESRKEIQITSTSKLDNKNAIIDAFNELIGLSIMLAARKKRFELGFVNAFKAKNFYTPLNDIQGVNNIVITKTFAESLAKQDMARKIKELILPIDRNTKTFPNFDKYPEPAQLALLELSYNTGVGSLVGDKTFYSQVIGEKWGDLATSTSYPKRGDKVFQNRNAQVQKWFKEASKKGKTIRLVPNE